MNLGEAQVFVRMAQAIYNRSSHAAGCNSLGSGNSFISFLDAFPSDIGIGGDSRDRVDQFLRFDPDRELDATAVQAFERFRDAAMGDFSDLGIILISGSKQGSTGGEGTLVFFTREGRVEMLTRGRQSMKWQQPTGLGSLT